ncbi:MAG: hypothetical protein A2007_02780 [Verrucomicrobia bacterium GWC2_42_7]|nr:MAG: hypothetical protein A2007_02780 [Verrucomicrobia bacterium GWC2_42_7]
MKAVDTGMEGMGLGDGESKSEGAPEVRKNVIFLVFKDLILLVSVLGLLFFLTIGRRPLANPDEGRYAEIPREMVVSGDWVTPRLNGVLYFEKPPLFYWMQAAAIKVGGLGESTLRLSNSLLGLLGCLITYAFGAYIFNRRIGLYAGFILGTSMMFFVLSQIITLDMAVSVFVTMALFAFIAGEKSRGLGRRLFFWLFYASMAFATLSKGLIGFLIPCTIVFMWTVFLGRWREIKKYYLISGGVIFFAIATPWHILCAMKNPSFAWYYFINEHFLRYLTPGHARVKPWWFFIMTFAVGSFPWLVFLPQSIGYAIKRVKKISEERKIFLFLSLWIVFVIAFFSISKSKLIPYILPTMPPFALIIACFLAEASQNLKKYETRLKWGYYSYGILLGILALSFPVIAYFKFEILYDLSGVGYWLLLPPVTFLLASIIMMTTIHKRRLSACFSFTILTMVAVFLATNTIAGQCQRPGTRQVAQSLKPYLKAEDKVFMLFDYYQDFPVYLSRLVGVAYNIPGEQAYGLHQEDLSNRYPDEKTFESLWISETRVYALSKKDQFEGFINRPFAPKTYIIDEDENFVVFTNHPM